MPELSCDWWVMLQDPARSTTVRDISFPRPFCAYCIIVAPPRSAACGMAHTGPKSQKIFKNLKRHIWIFLEFLANVQVFHDDIYLKLFKIFRIFGPLCGAAGRFFSQTTQAYLEGKATEWMKNVCCFERDEYPGRTEPILKVRFVGLHTEPETGHEVCILWNDGEPRNSLHAQQSRSDFLRSTCMCTCMSCMYN